MLLTLALAFVAGVITILSPCVLPLLPLILGAASQADRLRPWGIIAGFVLAFSAATLALSFLVRALGVPPDINRTVSALVLMALAVVLIVPAATLRFERWAGAVASLAPGRSAGGYGGGAFGGLAVGLGLGLAWSPCVGPIMASVITLALNQAVGPGAVAITLAFALGTALPMTAVLLGGRKLVRRLDWTQRHGKALQAGFGAVLALTAVAIWLGWDRAAQIALLDSFPGWQDALVAWQSFG